MEVFITLRWLWAGFMSYSFAKILIKHQENTGNQNTSWQKSTKSHYKTYLWSKNKQYHNDFAVCGVCSSETAGFTFTLQRGWRKCAEQRARTIITLQEFTSPVSLQPRGGFGTGSTALTLASSIAPCLCSNDFLHFSVISQAWNSPDWQMDTSWYICLAERICVEIATHAEWRGRERKRRFFHQSCSDTLQWLLPVTRGRLSLSYARTPRVCLRRYSPGQEVRLLTCFTK